MSFSAALSLFCRRIFTTLGTEAFPLVTHVKSQLPKIRLWC